MTTRLDPLSLNQIFGEGAYQNLNVLVIQKSALTRLTASPTNRAESLLAATLINALLNFEGVITDENNDPLTDENNQTLTFDNSEQFELLKMFGWKPFTVSTVKGKLKINQIIVESYELAANEYD